MNIFPNLKPEVWIPINLNEESKKTNLDLSNPVVCDNWLNNFHKSMNADYSYGGFLEDRTYIWRNRANEIKGSKIHLGIDYNVPAGSLVAMPQDGIVFHIMKDPRNNIGWGGRIIWKLNNSTYLLYGHLKQDIKLKIGQICKKGEIVAIIGDINDNGYWFPHLHVQIMNQTFIDHYENNLDEIDGYLPKNDAGINNVIDPGSIIR